MTNPRAVTGNPRDLSHFLAQHRAIVETIRTLYPDTSDADLADTIEGASGLPEAIVAVLRHALAREAMAKGLADLIEQMTARKRRLEDGAKLLRGSVLDAIQEAGIPMPLRAPDMTVSLGRGKPKVQITDPDAVPEDLCLHIREPDKKAIMLAIEGGDDVPGVVLGNPQAFLSIHRS